MVKKLKKLAEQQSAGAAGLQGSQLAGAIKDSAQQIWLAGMGAFAKAQQEGGKVFETLVQEGMSLQRKTQAAAEERLSSVSEKMSAMAGEVGTKAGAQWDKLETLFEERTAKALAKLGVPTAKDVDALIRRVDELAAAVAKLSKGKPSASAAKRAAATPPAKAAAKSASRARPTTKTAAKAPARRTGAKKASAAPASG